MQRIKVFCCENDGLTAEELDSEIKTLISYMANSYRRNKVDSMSFIQKNKKAHELVAIPPKNFDPYDKILSVEVIVINK